jgi:hypothetical protein
MSANLYTVSLVTEMYVGAGARKTDRAAYQRVYERVLRPIYLGEVGRVVKLPRGWLLNDQNLKQMESYMVKKWGMKPLAAGPEEPAAAAV